MSTTMTRMTYREACKQAIRDALQADSRCFVMGEDVGKYGGCYAVTKGCWKSSVRNASWTRRWPRWALWAPVWALRWPGCAPSSRS